MAKTPKHPSGTTLAADPAPASPIAEPTPAAAETTAVGDHSHTEGAPSGAMDPASPSPGPNGPGTAARTEAPAPATHSPAPATAENGGGGDLAAAPNSGPTVVRITARPKRGFWRAGVHHPARSVDYPSLRFTPRQIDALIAEPQLVVEIIGG